jgi:hypothetical protein
MIGSLLMGHQSLVMANDDADGTDGTVTPLVAKNVVDGTVLFQFERLFQFNPLILNSKAGVVEHIEIRLPLGNKDTLDPEFREETLRLYHLFDADGSGKLEELELDNVQTRLRISRGKSFGQHDAELNRRHVYMTY